MKDLYIKMQYRLILLFLALTLYSCQKKQELKAVYSTAADEIIDISTGMLNTGRSAKSIHYIDSAYQKFPEAGIVDLWKKYNFKYNYYLYYDINLKKSKIYVDSMFRVLEQNEKHYSFEFAYTLFAQGSYFIAEKKYPEAFKSFYDGKELAKKKLNGCDQAIFSNWLGIVRYKQGQFLQAIPYFKEALASSLACNEDAGFNKVFINPQGNYNNIALSFEKANVLDSAVVYYYAATNFINKVKHKYPERKPFIHGALGIVYGNLGGTYVKMNKFSEAEKYLKESIAINNRPGYIIEDAITAQVKLVYLYLRMSRLEEAKRLLAEIEAGEDGNGKRSYVVNDETKLRILDLKWQYADQSKDYVGAVKDMKLYYKFRDSLQEINIGLQTASMTDAFIANQQKYNLALLKKNDELKNDYLQIMMVVVLLISLSLVFFYINLKKYRKLNQQIREHNAQLKTSLKALEQSQEANTRIMKVVAHDLRNPIGAITTMVQLMLKVKDRPEKDLKCLEMIQRSGQSSLVLVNDLLNDESLSPLLKSEEDLSLILHYCIELLRPNAEAKHQQIYLDAKSLMVPVNHEKFWRVVSNLIANAIKFSPEHASINVSLRATPEAAIVSVKDNGIGIPDELKSHIFEMFTDAKRSGTSGEKPFGLGLAISRQIVEAHGGKIWFEATLGGGTTFYVSLPYQ